MEDKTNSTISKEEVSIDGLTKQQQKALDKTKKPFEKTVEVLRSILEEAESGY